MYPYYEQLKKQRDDNLPLTFDKEFIFQELNAFDRVRVSECFLTEKIDREANLFHDEDIENFVSSIH